MALHLFARDGYEAVSVSQIAGEKREVQSTFNIECLDELIDELKNMEWRESVHQQFIKAGITPKDYLDFVCRKKLRDI